MKPITPHDPLDDLIAAALHGDLTPEERTQFESRLANDPAAQAAYQEAQAMHDLLEKTHQAAQPTSDFEQRMVSGVRRKLQVEQHQETAWESVLVLWKGLRRTFSLRGLWVYSGVCGMVLVCVLAVLISRGNQVKGVFTTISSQLAMAGSSGYSVDKLENKGIANPAQGGRQPDRNGYVVDSNGYALNPGAPSSLQAKASNLRLANLDKAEAHYRSELAKNPYDQNASVHLSRIEQQKESFNNEVKMADAKKTLESINNGWSEPTPTTTPQGGTIRGSGFSAPQADAESSAATVSSTPPPPAQPDAGKPAVPLAPIAQANVFQMEAAKQQMPGALPSKAVDGTTAPSKPPETPAPDDRKLIRNAQLDLEVKSYQDAMDQITALTKSAGGYVDTSNSQRGGNGKLQGTVVVKVLPQNLDDFLLKLRDLGEVKNQSVSTDDVTKDYFDTQARLVNSQKMEVQLQDLLKRENGKVSDLLAVERELGRVRGEIEQMQGQLKLYDFQVQYATVTMQLAEKDLKQTAAYLLKEQDDFSLFATDVEATFQKSRQAAEDFKAQVLVANLNHNSGADVSALLVVSVPPDQIEAFLAEVRSLGRVANFTRDTKRVAKDGGDADQPADLTLTEKDKVMVNVSIRSDDETRKQVAMTVVAKTVDDALDQAKAAVAAQAGTSILGSSLNKTPQGQSTAQLSVRVPGKEYAALMDAFRALGRTASLSIQRNDDSGPGANGDDAPVIVALSLTDDDTPIQTTEMSVVGSNVDDQSQQIKKDAAVAGVEVKSSSFQRQPDGTEIAQMTFRLPMSKYAGFVANLSKLGKVESLSVQRDDRPDEARTDDTAPAEINLQLHNERGIVADDNGLGATLRHTFGEGADALFGSVRVIGVLIAFLLPWVFTLGLLAWVARRIYIWRKR